MVHGPLNVKVKYKIRVSMVKPTRCTNVSNLFYFGITLHVSDGLSIHLQEFTTVHTAAGICQTDTATATTVHTATGMCQTDACCCMYSREMMVDGKTIQNL